MKMTDEGFKLYSKHVNQRSYILKFLCTKHSGSTLINVLQPSATLPYKGPLAGPESCYIAMMVFLFFSLPTVTLCTAAPRRRGPVTPSRVPCVTDLSPCYCSMLTSHPRCPALVEHGQVVKACSIFDHVVNLYKGIKTNEYTVYTTE